LWFAFWFGKDGLSGVTSRLRQTRGIHGMKDCGGMIHDMEEENVRGRKVSFDTGKLANTRSL
jgi:hypothetical protein